MSDRNGAAAIRRMAAMGIAVPEILIPGKSLNADRWAVIACDQFSSEKSYWDETRRIVGELPSSLNLIIPECYLEEGDDAARAQAANDAMGEILESDVLRKLAPGFILVDRSTVHVESRKGLVIAVDLEYYDFAEGSTSPIRPTEGTIRDRLPPRMSVRRGARLDLPHILILIDDPENMVMTAAEAAAEEMVYNFDLMQGGGHISGRHIPAERMDRLAEAFAMLSGRSDLLFAVGDGNHSLATAREIWREKKAAGAPADDPARYALVEVENIHDPGLPFHPIHRVLFGIDGKNFAKSLGDKIGSPVTDSGSGLQTDEVLIINSDNELKWKLNIPEGRLAVEPLQEALDAWLTENPEAEIDYIHGEDSVRELVNESPDRLGIILPELDKSLFFSRITEVGPYPRKTFSIGEAVEKRYYLEAREI